MKISNSQKKNNSHGFTLIEMMVVLTILAIFGSIAAPSFSSLVRSNRISGKTNNLSSAIRTAKSESIKQGKNFTLCASTDYEKCSNSNEWNTGWIIFPDEENKKEPTKSSEIILIQKSFAENDQISSNNSSISINHEGFAFNLPTAGHIKFTFKTSPNDESAQRCLTINQSGTPAITKKGADCV